MVFNGIQQISNSRKEDLLANHPAFERSDECKDTQVVNFKHDNTDEIIDLSRRLEDLL